MAKCPACGYKLKLTDISQNCPKCKVNMRFVTFEETFYREAKAAELSNAKTSVFVTRVKASFIASKLTIAKLVVMLLPLASMMLPFFTVNLSFPLYHESVPVSAFEIYNKLFSGGFDYIFAMSSLPISGAIFSGIKLLTYLYTLTAVFALLCLLTSLFGFLAINKMPKFTSIFAALGMAGTVASTAYAFSLAAKAKELDSIVLIDVNPLIALTFVLFTAVLIVNLLLCKKGIPVTYEEGMLERVAIAKKVKAKEIDIDSLPQPIVETEETKKIDIEIQKAREDLVKRRNEKKEEEKN